MNKFLVLLSLVLAVLLVSTMTVFAMVTCPGTYNINTWTACFGVHTFPTGVRYVEEFKSGKRHGQGKFTFSNGSIKEGVWKNNNFQNAQKIPGSNNSIELLLEQYLR